TIDISGGWVTYQAGQVRTTQLIDAAGRIVDIGHADPNDLYIGILNGFSVSHPHWGISEIYTSPLLSGTRFEPSYTEGRDAGTLTIKSSVIAFDGTVYAHAYAGQQQLINGKQGTGTSTVYGDQRAVQAAPSELPAGGMLFIQAEVTTPDPSGN